ncbi:hypothetical protein [Xanthomonas vesicatoria]|uniref:Uncharacterized protein n=3 Tax=Xanthomonas vesicatoria TaxID=56460 RepID=A0ABS8L778_9XANT|nr:hypothetical protein [Xanthomonas vesicatoria]MCC8597658.1 hypothetical protein [Xanthomonas vesicatoria]MCC8606197.1 hypothetical protein [Xanthomonas vesicatoria]MCC8618346.1 hypothetical protein [Xanthomonas vesicatoria]MCC8621065.1 hypothetical protein [Xanthomonas vesicatoria]MCC8626907.1 hypothetical protein [Xanthomonas vesicatoria]
MLFLSGSRSKFRVALCVCAMMVVVPFAQARDPRIPGAVELYAFNSSPSVKALLLTDIRGPQLCLKLGGAKNRLQNIDKNVQYTVIGMSTLDCRTGTGVAGVNTQFITLGDTVILTINTTGIGAKIQ